ncbi:MAG: HAD family hydrolase [Clostridia bacterium]|nr:HAD family hydrolase [Clostridia bacterium]
MNTIIFDLDGTLLPMDTNHFMKLYRDEITKAFHDFNEHETLFEKIMASVYHTVKNPQGDTNENKFFKHFLNHVDEKIDLYHERFEWFYLNDFNAVKASTYQSEEMLEAIQILKEKNYTLVIATNPIFPMVANYQRMQWAGLNPDDFKYISSFEKNRACKPHLAFYEEVLSSIETEGKNVLMVGNDAQEDLTISRLGAKTFLITNHLIDKNNDIKKADYYGNYKDFLEFVKTLERK